MNKEVCDDVLRFVDERVDRIRRLPDLNMTDDEKVYWIDRFNFAGNVVVTFASVTTNLMKEKTVKNSSPCCGKQPRKRKER